MSPESLQQDCRGSLLKVFDVIQLLGVLVLSQDSGFAIHNGTLAEAGVEAFCCCLPKPTPDLLIAGTPKGAAAHKDLLNEPGREASGSAL